MQVIRTVVCKLVDPLDKKPVQELFLKYSQACTEIAQYGRNHLMPNAIQLHHKLYRDLRKKYELPANLVVTALRRASGSLKTAHCKGKFEFKPTFIGLDDRTFTLRLEDEEVTVSSHVGRIKFKLDIGDYQRETFKTGEIRSATLVNSKRGLFINVQVKSEVEEVQGTKVLGVDLGIRNIAVTSTGAKHDGKLIRKYRQDRWRIRASLQSNGTRNSKRVLKSLSGKEARRARDLNHVVAKSIVSEARNGKYSTIAFENLKGIRNRLRVPNKHSNRMVSLWSFFQLREFVRYKAALYGIKVVEVEPAYTSQTCHSCGKRGFRNQETFTCTTCGEFDADLNAAKNIAVRGARVNEPGSDGSSRKTAPVASPGL